jgi:DNA-binding CsgD family transcriptional regulator
MSWLPAHLPEAVGGEVAFSYDLEAVTNGCAVTFSHWHGFARAVPELHRDLNAYFSNAGDAWGMFNPSRPEARQRNQAIAIPPGSALRRRTSALGSWLHRIGFDEPARSLAVRRTIETHDRLFAALGVRDTAQLRVLLCDGARLMAWIGVLQEGAFSRQACARLAKLAPLIRTRMRREHRMSRPWSQRLGQVLSLITEPAMIVDEAGRIISSNDARWSAAALDRTGAEDLDAIDLTNDRTLALVLPRKSRRSLDAALCAVAAELRISGRQADVLRQVIWGRSNQEIAQALDLLEATVERRVAQLLRASRLASRSALIAMIWSRARASCD